MISKTIRDREIIPWCAEKKKTPKLPRHFPGSKGRKGIGKKDEEFRRISSLQEICFGLGGGRQKI